MASGARTPANRKITNAVSDGKIRWRVGPPGKSSATGVRAACRAFIKPLLPDLLDSRVAPWLRRLPEACPRSGPHSTSSNVSVLAIRQRGSGNDEIFEHLFMRCIGCRIVGLKRCPDPACPRLGGLTYDSKVELLGATCDDRCGRSVHVRVSA